MYGRGFESEWLKSRRVERMKKSTVLFDFSGWIYERKVIKIRSKCSSGKFHFVPSKGNLTNPHHQDRSEFSEEKQHGERDLIPALLLSFGKVTFNNFRNAVWFVHIHSFGWCRFGATPIPQNRRRRNFQFGRNFATLNFTLKRTMAQTRDVRQWIIEITTLCSRHPIFSACALFSKQK